MRIITPRFLSSALLGAALLIPVAITPTLQAQTYHDRAHNDDHQWNAHEDRAYRIWVKENHRKYVEFARLRDEDRESYWAWRHNHSDAALKIDIR